MESVLIRDLLCVHRCTCLKYWHLHTESNHGVGSHLPRSPYDYMVLCALYCLCFFAVVVHYAGVYAYMYIHTVCRAVSVLSASFSSFVPHWHQLSIVGDKDSEIARQICMTYIVHTCMCTYMTL